MKAFIVATLLSLAVAVPVASPIDDVCTDDAPVANPAVVRRQEEAFLAIVRECQIKVESGGMSFPPAAECGFQADPFHQSKPRSTTACLTPSASSAGRSPVIWRSSRRSRGSAQRSFPAVCLRSWGLDAL